MTEDLLGLFKEDLKGYCFRISFLTQRKKRQSIYFWIPCPIVGGCLHSIKLEQTGNRLKLVVTEEELTKPDGPAGRKFQKRVGIPGMCTASDFGIKKRTHNISLGKLIKLEIQPSFLVDHVVVWEKNRQGRLSRRTRRGTL